MKADSPNEKSNASDVSALDKAAMIDDQSQSSCSQAPSQGMDQLGDRRNLAALKLQKVYKSFRTRRQLADCAVLVEQRWWKVLDFAELKHSSISFFDIEKQESVTSRWSRARTRAAKLGKGLSKDAKAQKLALQHWLEAIDPRHRYGHNLQFYYVRWLHCESKQPFFYWLDIGEGKKVNLIDRCPRFRLQHQCIKYLGPKEREPYEVVVENGRIIYKHSRRAVDTTGGPKGTKWIFVLSTLRTLYVGQKIKGNFQHSSFLAGGATLSAGRLVVEEGILKAVWPHSGHYLPTEENFQAFMSFLVEHDVDPAHVKKSPADEEEEIGSKWGALPHRRISSKPEFLKIIKEVVEDNMSVQDAKDAVQQPPDPPESATSFASRRPNFRSKIAQLQIPSKKDMVVEEFKTPQQPPESSFLDYSTDYSTDGYETAEDTLLSEDDFAFPKVNIFDEFEDDVEEDPIPQETILRRINLHKKTRSYQLGEQLSFRWTTGAGPRIGCVRDYPSRLQFQVLEQVHLSPRSESTPRCAFSSPKMSGPSGLRREVTKSPLGSEQVTLSPSEGK